MINAPLKYMQFIRDFLLFRKRLTRSAFQLPMRWRDRLSFLHDRTRVTEFDRHYVLHTAWAARILAETKPVEHVDCSSSLYFVAITSAFLPIRFYDYRPAALGLDNLTCAEVDLLHLPFADHSLLSISCMHVVEHIGLGRYGDQLDPDGDRKAMSELVRVLAVGGSLLVVVPVGQPRIRFNGHRIYPYDRIVEYFAELELVEFALIPDDQRDGNLVRHATKKLADAQQYGCGCFWFKRSDMQ